MGVHSALHFRIAEVVFPMGGHRGSGGSELGIWGPIWAAIRPEPAEKSIGSALEVEISFALEASIVNEELGSANGVGLVAAAVTRDGPVPVVHRAEEVVRARLAVVAPGREAGFSTRDLADSLRLAQRTVRDLASRPVDPRLFLAARRMVTLLERHGDLQVGLRLDQRRGTPLGHGEEAVARCSPAPR